MSIRGPMNIPPGMRHGEEEYEHGGDHGNPFVQFTCGRCKAFQPAMRRRDLIRDENHDFLCAKCSVGMTRQPHVTPCALCATKA